MLVSRNLHRQRAAVQDIDLDEFNFAGVCAYPITDRIEMYDPSKTAGLLWAARLLIESVTSGFALSCLPRTQLRSYRPVCVSKNRGLPRGIAQFWLFPPLQSQISVAARLPQSPPV